MPFRPRRSLSGAAAIALLALSFPRCGAFNDVADPGTLAIQKFMASPADISSGASTTLTWEVAGADKVEIDNGVGTVDAKGSRLIHPEWTTSFNLVARSGSSQATATVQVRVAPGTAGSPSPSPSPSPSASPSPGPSPSASPSPGASPSPSPSPSPSTSPSPSPSPSASPSPDPSPTPVTCGAPASSAGNCSVTITRPRPLNAGECLEVTAVSVNQGCPVGIATVRSLRFDVTAHTPRTGLRWQRSAGSSDVLTPSSGAVSNNGTTSAQATDLVLDSGVTIEILDGDTVLLAFTLRHY